MLFRPWAISICYWVRPLFLEWALRVLCVTPSVSSKNVFGMSQFVYYWQWIYKIVGCNASTRISNGSSQLPFEVMQAENALSCGMQLPPRKLMPWIAFVFKSYVLNSLFVELTKPYPNNLLMYSFDSECETRQQQQQKLRCDVVNGNSLLFLLYDST